MVNYSNYAVLFVASERWKAGKGRFRECWETWEGVSTA